MATSPNSPEANWNPSTSSAAASRARISASQESAKASKALAQVFGLNSPALLGSLDLDTCSLKTFQVCLFTMQCDEWSESWPDYSMWDLLYVYELRTSGPPTCENEFSLWPAAVVGDHWTPSTDESAQRETAKHNLRGTAITWPTPNTRDAASAARHTTETGIMHPGTTLTDAIRMWPTARAEDGESCGNHPGAVDSLTGATKNWKTPHGMSNQWRTPNTRDHHLQGPRLDAEQRQITLCDQAEKMWPTPNVPNGGRTSNTSNYREDGSKQQVDLGAVAKMWQTPGTDSFRSCGGDRKDEMGLDQQARFFPTPASTDYRTPNTKPYNERKGKTKGEQLPNFVEHCLPSPLAPQTPDGLPSSPHGQTSRRRLNCRFVEWLLGFPIGWTEI
jgi:hypothetical protein